MTIIEFPVRRSSVVTGIAIMALPLVALGVKFLNPGWLMLFLLYGGILIGAAYVFLAVMASSGFFGKRAAFSFVDSRRGRIAGLGHGISLVLATFFLTDGGDSTWTSAFISLFGLDLETWVDPSDAIASVLFIVAIGAYLWFLVEWVIAVRVKRRLV